MQPPDRQLHHFLQRLNPFPAPGTPGKSRGYAGSGSNQKGVSRRLAERQSSRALRVPEESSSPERGHNHPETDGNTYKSHQDTGGVSLECSFSRGYTKTPSTALIVFASAFHMPRLRFWSGMLAWAIPANRAAA